MTKNDEKTMKTSENDKKAAKRREPKVHDEKTMKTSENDKNENDEKAAKRREPKVHDEKTMKTNENDKNGINLLKIIITQLGMK